MVGGLCDCGGVTVVVWMVVFSFCVCWFAVIVGVGVSMVGGVIAFVSGSCGSCGSCGDCGW